MRVLLLAYFDEINESMIAMKIIHENNNGDRVYKMMIVIVFLIMAVFFNYRVMTIVMNVSGGNGEVMQISSVTQTFNNAICKPLRRIKLILN